MTPQEWSKKLTTDYARRTAAIAAAGEQQAQEASLQLAALAARAGNGAIRVRNDGETVVLSLSTTSRPLAAAARRWARDPQRAKDLAEGARDVRA